MNPFTQRKQELLDLRNIKPQVKKKIVNNDFDEHLFFKCNECGHLMSQSVFENEGYLCSGCNHHYPFSAKMRIDSVLDTGTFTEIDKQLSTVNALDFPEYSEKIEKLQEKTSLSDAIVTGTGLLDGKKIAVGVMDTKFLMGSMGAVVGEKVTRLFEHAVNENLPVLLFCASGGARMQEGIISLMQMAKTSGAVKLHSNKGLLYISVLTHPTTGGVTASFASLADVILAEPKALIGFAGPRVIESTIKEKLPVGFQSAEYLEECGFVDRIVQRCDIKTTVSQLLELHNIK